MTKVTILARNPRVRGNPPEAAANVWATVLANYPRVVRSDAANLAAHSWDVTEVGDRLLVCCSWSGGHWWTRDGERITLTEENLRKLYEVLPSDHPDRYRLNVTTHREYERGKSILVACKINLEALVGKLSSLGFDEDHTVGESRASVKRSHRAEGRNWVD